MRHAAAGKASEHAELLRQPQREARPVGDDDEEAEAFDENEELSFDCPHCGKTMQIKAADIDFDESPLCPSCHKPFFPDAIEGEDEGDDR